MLFAILIAFTAQGPVTILPQSRLWMEGDSNFKPWTCEAGEARLKGESASLQIEVPVKSFRCNEDLLDAKLRGALKAEAFPSILFSLESAGPIAGRAPLVRVSGALTVAGQTGSVSLVASVTRLPDGSFLLRGAFAISMASYGVEPPSAMLGLVHASDEVVVKFDVRARRDDARQLSRANQ